jgi:hypothetical protein
MDGGGSSTIVRSRSVNGSPLVLNRPSDGKPRSVTTSIGFHSVAYKPRQDLFLRGSGGDIKHRAWISGSNWKAWKSLGQPAGGSASDPTAVSRHPGRRDVFVTGTNGEIYTRWFNNGSWNGSGWVSLGGSAVGGPTAASMDHDRIDLFWRGTDNTLRWKRWTQAGGWNNPTNLGGDLDSDPAAVSWGADRIDVFAKNSNGNLIQRAFNNGNWGNWHNHGHVVVGAPTVCARVANRLDVFWRTTNGSLRHKRWTGMGWTGVKNLGAAGATTGNPGAVSRVPGHISVFIPRANGNVGVRHWTPKNGWSRWLYGAGDNHGAVGVNASSWTNDAGTH